MRTLGTVLVLVGAGVLGCGGGGDGGGGGGGGGPNPTAIAKAAVSGDGQTGTVGTALADPFCATVTQDGQAKAGATVAWTSQSGGTMNPASTSSAADGSACSTLTLGQGAGAQTARATLANANGSPLTFNATATAGAASILAKNTGDGQHAEINTQVANPISIKITDQFGNPVGGSAVSWAVTSGSAGVNPTSGNASPSGVASTVVTMGGTAGPVAISATSTGLTGSPQTFNLTADPPPPPPPTDITINVNNPGSFSPAVDTVAVGGTVTWNWVGSGHTVTSTGSPSFVSDPAGISSAPHTYGPITFNTAGTYYYYCEVHGNPGNPPTGMAGRIVVR